MYRDGEGQLPSKGANRGRALKRKNYRLPQSKLDAARRVLGTRTETETIELALDLVAFGERLAAGTERARGRPWRDPFGETDASRDAEP
jgi:hypothetical protein